MHPILFTIGGHTIYSYGFFITAGYLAGVVLFLYLTGRDGRSVWTGVDIILWMLPAALVGAKLLFIATNRAAFARSPSPLGPGWSYQGALFGALVVAVVLFRKRRLDAWRWLDTAAPALALIVAVGRVGCLMAGCCWGAPTRAPWGIVFTESNVAPLSVPLHPTQVYYLIANLIIVAALLVRRKTTAFRGELILLFVLMYVTSRSIIDPFRGAPERPWFLGTLTTYQLITIVAIGVTSILYYRIRKRNRIDRKKG
jgi:phosphatidylglycerol:prolipoprotein diacylglycerol transferase